MTKEELIELSDLNREDNIKYISSEAQGIAITLDSDKYAPTLCKLERAYICGRRKSEEQITELEQKLEQTEKDLTDYQFNYPKIKDLEKENAELKDKNTEAKEIIRALLFHLNKDTFAVIYETREESIKKAEQFLKEVEK